MGMIKWDAMIDFVVKLIIRVHVRLFCTSDKPLESMCFIPRHMRWRSVILYNQKSCVSVRLSVHRGFPGDNLRTDQ